MQSNIANFLSINSGLAYAIAFFILFEYGFPKRIAKYFLIEISYSIDKLIYFFLIRVLAF